MFTRQARLFTAASAVLLSASGAQAHVTLSPRDARAGAPYRAVLGVTHGCEGAATTRLRVEIPEGVIGVKPMPKPGWQLETRRGPYARSYDFFHGQQLGEGVKEIAWSGRLDDQFYDEFVFAASLSDALEGTVAFPVTQECDGTVVRWVETPAAGQSAHALTHPAPSVTLAAAKPAPAAGAPAVKAGALVIEAPWARATPGGAKIGGGYLKITNTGAEPDRLIGGSFPVAARFEVHEMARDGDVMRMRALPQGLEIKPGETVELKPGGLHIMFVELREPLKEGQTVRGTLNFEKAGQVPVAFSVRSIGATAPSHDAGSH